jgi:hypothetical protein
MMIPIFIGGTGRSGTTILKRILSCHSTVVSLPVELRVIVDPGGALDLIAALSDRWSPYNADAAIQRFRDLMLDCARSRFKPTNILQKVEKRLLWSLGISSRRYLGLGFALAFDRAYYSQRLDQLIEELSYYATRGCWDGSPAYRLQSKIFEAGPIPREDVEKPVARYFQDLFTHLVTYKRQPTHWLDDTPYNLLHVHELLRIFPDLKFIHIYRDPRDVMASYRRFKWGGDNFVAIARRLAGIYKRWFEIRRQLPSCCFLEVGLETLVAQRIDTLNTVCKFVGLEFEEGLRRIPLDKAHTGRWERDIPEQEWEAARHYLELSIKAYGYSID